MPILKRIFKVILILVLILIVLGGVGAFALAKWVNPNSFKPQIVSAVDAATGRHLTLAGDLSWNFFPRLGIHIGAAALSNPASFTQVNFAEINSANLYLSWSDLLHGQIAVSSLNVDGLQVFLRQKGNQNNWSFMPATPSKPSKTPIPQKPVGSSSKAVAFSIDSFSLTNAQISYDNDLTKSHLAFSNVNVNINQFAPGLPFPISASGNINLDDSLSGTVKLNTLVEANLDQGTVNLKDLAMEGHLTYLTNASQAVHLSTHISGQVQVNLNQQTLSVNGVQFDLNQVLDGKMDLSLKNWSLLNYSGHVQLSAFSLPDLASSLGVTLPALPNASILNQVTASSSFSGTPQKLSINPLHVAFTGTNIEGSVNVSSFQPLRVGESLTADQLDASNFMDLYGAKLPMQDIAVSGTLNNGRSLAMNQNVTIQDITLQGFDLKALIDQMNQMVTNLLNVHNIMDATGQINQAMATFKNQSINASNGKSTDLGSLNANIVLNQGVVTTPTMVIKGPLVQVNGNGQVNLNQKIIDYTLTSKVVAPGKLQGLMIPYNLSGPFNKMQQGVNWVVVQAEIVKYLTVALSSTVTHTVNSAVDGAVNALKGLFGR